MDNENLKVYDKKLLKQLDSEKAERALDKKCKKDPDISICVLFSRKHLLKWTIFQIEKQRQYLFKKGIASEVVIISPFFDNYLKKYSHRLIIETSKDVAYLRNVVCSEAKGKYIGFIDDDDWYPDYRMHLQYISLEFYHRDINICTVDNFLMIDNINNNTYEVNVASESCLFFKRKYFNDSLGFKKVGNAGEGQFFCKDQKVYIETEIDMIVAIKHDTNQMILNEKIRICEGIPLELRKAFSPFELDFLEKKSFIQ